MKKFRGIIILIVLIAAAVLGMTMFNASRRFDTEAFRLVPVAGFRENPNWGIHSLP